MAHSPDDDNEQGEANAQLIIDACNNYYELQAENEKLRERDKARIDLINRLAEWSKKYPRDSIYSSSRKPEMDNELIEMEEQAKKLQELENGDE